MLKNEGEPFLDFPYLMLPKSISVLPKGKIITKVSK
jgi:hypothetical protein